VEGEGSSDEGDASAADVSSAGGELVGLASSDASAGLLVGCSLSVGAALGWF
jgi:hypothetical protein